MRILVDKQYYPLLRFLGVKHTLINLNEETAEISLPVNLSQEDEKFLHALKVVKGVKEKENS